MEMMINMMMMMMMMMMVMMMTGKWGDRTAPVRQSMETTIHLSWKSALNLFIV